MKQKYNSNKKNQKVQKTRPFEGKIKQLNKETLILVNLMEAKDFVKECFARKIIVDVGSTNRGGVIIYKK